VVVPADGKISFADPARARATSRAAPDCRAADAGSAAAAPEGLQCSSPAEQGLRAHAGQISFPGGSVDNRRRGTRGGRAAGGAPRRSGWTSTCRGASAPRRLARPRHRLRDHPGCGAIRPAPAVPAARCYPWAPSPAEIRHLGRSALAEFCESRNLRVEMREREGACSSSTGTPCKPGGCGARPARILNQTDHSRGSP